MARPARLLPLPPPPPLLVDIDPFWPSIKLLLLRLAAQVSEREAQRQRNKGNGGRLFGGGGGGRKAPTMQEVIFFTCSDPEKRLSRRAGLFFCQNCPPICPFVCC